MRDMLSRIIGRVGESATLYGVLIIALVLLFADWYITYGIFSDVLRVKGFSLLAIYVFSGVIAVLFVVFLEFGMEKLSRQAASQVQRYTPYFVGVIAALLLIVY